MPLSRYEIRNEYSLADPDLYRAADKDDPEALLEGIAMAGLVGVLRQLGDLAEFAAEIFHNLHEEVMATAARGHDLMIRVQQLETEVPSIERAFLSQTDHSSFFYHAGVDWHPNLHVDHNLVTQGDLPRFIMDSYEECRAPPRLFLLDKFDVAGAGACLKRYTDPSIFKVEKSEMTRGDVQREKKILKAKKKGPRWKNGETREVLPTSHAKLHQLFLEEHVENGVSNPARRAKLKRRLNGFPFDSKTGKSYMEKLLKSPNPDDHKVLHEVTVNSLPLMLATNGHTKSEVEVPEEVQATPDSESVRRKRSIPSSPDRDEITLNRSWYESSEVPIDGEICEVPSSYPSTATDGISSTLDKVSADKVIAVDAESNREGSLTGYQSDDIASEVDNYVDAPSTIESEMDTDSEVRVKSDFSSRVKNKSLMSDANEELRTKSSDSQSTGDSTISDEGNNSSRKEMSSFSSDSPSTSAENPRSERFSAEGFSSADIPEIEIVDASSYRNTADEDFPVDQHSKPVVSDNTCNDSTDATTNPRPDFEMQASGLCTNESLLSLEHFDSDGVVGKSMPKGPVSDDTAHTLDDKEKKTNLVIDPPCSSNVFHLESQSGDDSPRSSAGEHLVDELDGDTAPCISTVHYSQSHAADNSGKIFSDLLHEDESNWEDQNLVENNVLSQSTDVTPQMVFSEHVVPSDYPDIAHNEINIKSSVAEGENLISELDSKDFDIAHNENNIKSTVAEGENLTSELDNEDFDASVQFPNPFPCIVEAFPGEKFEEASFANFPSAEAEESHSNNSIDNQNNSENLLLLHLATSPNWQREGLDAHEEDVVPEKETSLSKSIVFETLKSCEDVELQGTGTTDHISPIVLDALESSCTPDDHEQPAQISDTMEMDSTSSTEQGVAEIFVTANLKSLEEDNVLLDDSDSEADSSNTADIASAVPAVSDNEIINNDHLSTVLNKLEEENIQCDGGSGLHVENETDYLSGSHSGLGEGVGQTEAATSGVETVFYNTIIEHPISELSDVVPNSLLHSEDDRGLESVRDATIQSVVEQSGLDSEQEHFRKNGPENHVLDTPPLPIDYDVEEPPAQEKNSLPPSQLNQELLHSDEVSLALSPLLPVNHQQILDYDGCKGDNNSASSFSLVDDQSPPSVSGLPSPSNHDNDVHGYPEGPLGSFFPPSNPFSETNQINLADLPPLPPLPPVQWRLAKFQHASSSTEGEMIKHEEFFPQLISLPAQSTDEVSSSQPAVYTDDIDSLPPNASTDEVSSSQPIVSTNDVNSLPPNASADDDNPSPRSATSDDVDTLPAIASTDAVSSSPPTACTDGVDSSPTKVSSEDVKPSPLTLSGDEVGSLPAITSTDDVSSSTPSASVNGVSSSHEEVNHCLIQTGTEIASEEEKKVENSCSSSETNGMHGSIDLPPKMENMQQQFVMPIPEGGFTLPTEENGVANGGRTVKLPRPRNPLVNDVAVLDKSKLRKVTERVMPQIQKVDERDSLLEQIRARSFNLKPAVTSRPSTRGPNTNLKVAAILEKANAIRQALAGSDEDDDDNWSDS